MQGHRMIGIEQVGGRRVVTAQADVFYRRERRGRRKTVKNLCVRAGFARLGDLGGEIPATKCCVWRLLPDELGQSTVASFPYIAILLLFLLGLAAFVAKIRPAQASVAAAARVCVRQAVESLDVNRALDQGAAAAYAALEARHLDPARARVQVTPLGLWGRVARVECRVDYTVRLNVLFGGLFAPPEKVLSSAYQLDVQRYKSLWGEP